MGELKGKIGLEIHAYPVTKEKMFCKCRAKRGKGVDPNRYICPICCGMPGAKPMLVNKSAVEKTVLIGKMLGCKIEKIWKWQRKHYDWPDMPKGYQNTVSGGLSKSVGSDGKFDGIGISSMHLEEDPASWNPETGGVDYNRSGLPLVEIITEPDFSTAEEVTSWLKRLVHHLGYLKIIDSADKKSADSTTLRGRGVVDKDAGIKVDVNVSIPGKSERVEIKNINSIENIGKAIEYELSRQGKEGGKVKETRRWNSLKGKTEVMRKKEGADDYRFITDPDLRDVEVTEKFISDLEKKLPESPDAKLNKLIKKHKIGKKSAEILARNIDVIEFYEKIIDKGVDAKFALPWVTIELLRYLNYNKTSLDKVDLKVEDFVSLLNLVKEKKITELQGKQILNKFYPKSFNPEGKVQGRIDDEKELEKIIEKVIGKNKKSVEDYKKGEKNAFNYLIGEVMRETNRRADYVVARKVLKKMLK